MYSFVAVAAKQALIRRSAGITRKGSDILSLLGFPKASKFKKTFLPQVFIRVNGKETSNEIKACTSISQTALGRRDQIC
jgi:hypothetical protein